MPDISPSTLNSLAPNSGGTAGDFALANPANTALMGMLRQLLAGGSSQQQQLNATRNSEIATAQNNRSGYSKEAAFGDATGLMAQTMRQALEKLLPGINTAALGAGASASSMRALLTQKAAENAGQAASAQGLEAAVKYGGVSNQFTDAITRLLNIQDPTMELALKAAQNLSSGGSGGSGSKTVGNPSLPYEPYPKTPSAPQAPMNFGGGGTVSGSNINYFGPTEPESHGNIVGTTADTLRELAGDTRFRGYTF